MCNSYWLQYFKKTWQNISLYCPQGYVCLLKILKFGCLLRFFRLHIYILDSEFCFGYSLKSENPICWANYEYFQTLLKTSVFTSWLGSRIRKTKLATLCIAYLDSYNLLDPESELYCLREGLGVKTASIVSTIGHL